jgi:hypothetical protein
MSVRAEWEPNWLPLEESLRAAGVSVQACTAFMWMYRAEGLEFYKHIDTRRYLILDRDGGCYSYTSNGSVRVPFLPAYRWACDGSQCGPMPIAKEAGHESGHS